MVTGKLNVKIPAYPHVHVPPATEKELTRLHFFAKKCYGYGLLSIKELQIIWLLAHNRYAKVESTKYGDVFAYDLLKMARGWRNLNGY